MRTTNRLALGLLLAPLALLPACKDSQLGQKDGSMLPDQGTGDLGAPKDAAMQPADLALPAACNGSTTTPSQKTFTPTAAPAFTIAAGLKIETIAQVGGARELAALPNGDLLVATTGTGVYLVPNADEKDQNNVPVLPDNPVSFTSVNDAPVNGVTFAGPLCTIYVASQHGIYSIPYQDGMTSAPAGTPIAQVRQGGISGTDGDTHTTTSVAFAGGALYAGVGSSCNACTESDPTRATIQKMMPNGAGMTTRATRFRNAIALAVNPETGTLWAGGAGQDGLPLGHPYEFFDAVTSHPTVADYGWPDCEENQHPYTAGTDCSKTVAPLIETPAYSTLIGAVFYPSAQTGTYALPAQFRGGFIITAHGAWHTIGGKQGAPYYTPPRVLFVKMNGDQPATAVNWNDPSKQWTEVIGGFENSAHTARIGRPTGIAIGPQGSLFLADDQNGLVYRIRPQ